MGQPLSARNIYLTQHCNLAHFRWVSEIRFCQFGPLHAAALFTLQGVRALTVKTLTSWTAAQREIAAIVELINADPALARAAMANPLLALEEIGYKVEPRVRREFEERIRFSVEQVAQLHQLRKRISEVSQCGLDPDALADVHKVLFEDFGLPRQTDTAMLDTPAALQYLPRPGWMPAPADPLEALRGQHELVDLLLQYRAIEASEPRLASREVFDAVRTGQLGAKLRAAVIRLRAAS
jgi:hypothetical protein